MSSVGRSRRIQRQAYQTASGDLQHIPAKYTPEGGTVRVDLSANDGFARFSIRDIGIGIVSAGLPYIFDRF
jgi:signal transduction histidine kinase